MNNAKVNIREIDKIIVDLKNKIIVYPILDPLNISPSTNSQHFEPEGDYAYGEVNVSAVTSNIDSNIKAENIKKDITILGVTGTVEEYKAPTISNETLIFSKNASVNEGVLNV